MSDAERLNRHSVNKIFGDPLPDVTNDERDEASLEGEAERDRWLQENVPPHHG